MSWRPKGWQGIGRMLSRLLIGKNVTWTATPTTDWLSNVILVDGKEMDVMQLLANYRFHQYIIEKYYKLLKDNNIAIPENPEWDVRITEDSPAPT